jgi:hypothetical protein
MIRPRPLPERAYDKFARNRFLLTGDQDFCMPPPSGSPASRGQKSGPLLTRQKQAVQGRTAPAVNHSALFIFRIGNARPIIGATGKKIWPTMPYNRRHAS